VSLHDRLTEKVQAVLDFHKESAAATTPQQKTALERQITATDGEIDRWVYELYGLTEAEIGIVEKATDR